jgi:cytochrome c551/c552
MKRILFITLCIVPLWAADPNRGGDLIRREGCLNCHTVNSDGAGHEGNFTGPDLANRLAATYTPSALASALWNHTPEMWEQARGQRMTQPAANSADWADMFAYLYSLQFFERPAEVRRGKQLLTEKRCLDCHAAAGPGPAPEKWKSITDPVALVYEMWAHAPAMARRTTQYRREWARLSGTDFRDLTAYLQTLQNTPRNRQLNLPAAATGKALHDSNCANCHTGPRALSALLRNKTWMDIGAGMWNHAPNMRNVPVVSVDDMRKVLAYVWELQYQGLAGNVEQGHRTFDQKGCGTCHTEPQRLAGKAPDAFGMAAFSWGPARDMHRMLTQQGKAWPSLSAVEVNNLGAYLRSLR